LSFSEATAVTGGPTNWKAELEEGWDIFGITNGGYLMAVATRAMGAEADGRQPLSVATHYLNPATAGSVEIEVTALKRGRGLSMIRASMSRDGRPLTVTTAVFAAPDRPRHRGHLVLGARPDLPAPEQCILAEPSETGPMPPPFTGQVEVRVHPADARALLGEKTGNPVMRGWFRLRDDEPHDALSVILACDAFPPAIYNSELPIGWTPTVDLSVQVRDPRPTGWLQCQFTTRFVTDGLLEEDGEIWDESGRPVALSRQLALVPN
jgi:acyl-CoA thioesterase